MNPTELAVEAAREELLTWLRECFGLHLTSQQSKDRVDSIIQTCIEKAVEEALQDVPDYPQPQIESRAAASPATASEEADGFYSQGRWHPAERKPDSASTGKDEFYECIEGLRYIAESPDREHGGFHPNAIKTAKLALKLLTATPSGVGQEWTDTTVYDLFRSNNPYGCRAIAAAHNATLRGEDTELMNWLELNIETEKIGWFGGWRKCIRAAMSETRRGEKEQG